MSKPITVNKLLSPSRVFPANTGTHVGRFFVANVMEVTTSADIGGLFYLQKSTGGSRVFGLGVSSEDDYKQDLVLCDRTVELSEEEMRGELRPLEDVNKVHVFTPDGPFAIIHDEHAINLLPSFEEDDIDCTIREDNRVLLAHRNRWIDVNIYTTSDSIDLHQSLGDKQMSDPLFWIVDSEDGNGDPESTSITRVFSVHYCGKDFNDQTEDVNDGKVAIHEEEAKAESSGKSSRSSKKSKKRKARSAASAKRVKKGRIGGDAKEPAEVIDARLPFNMQC